MSTTPLLLPTLVVLAGCWNHARVIALSAAVSGAVLLTACFTYPGWSAEAIVDFGAPAMAIAVSIARLIGAACFLYSVVLFIRLRQIPW